MAASGSESSKQPWARAVGLPQDVGMVHVGVSKYWELTGHVQGDSEYVGNVYMCIEI